MTVPEDRQCGEHPSRCGLAVRPLQRRQVRERPEKPHGHGGQHRRPELPSTAHQPRAELGPQVDERRANGEERGHEQPDRNRDLEAGAALGEEDADRAERVQAHEAPGRHERQRQEQDAGVPAPVGGLAGRVAEGDRDAADGAEDEEVRLVVVELGVELLPQQQRDEPDQRQRDREDAGERDRPGRRSRPRAAEPPGLAGDAQIGLRFCQREHAWSVGGAPSAAGTILRRPRGRRSKAAFSPVRAGGRSRPARGRSPSGRARRRRSGTCAAGRAGRGRTSPGRRRPPRLRRRT